LSDIKKWRENIGYVGQDSILLDDTILNNITFRDQNISKKKIDEVIKLSSLGDILKNSSEGLSMVAGERGINLSGGQKQRISMARAILRSPLLLLMDEPTSALDKSTKRNILSNLKILKKKITIICITHDQELIEISDSVINIKKS
jgi:ABC-type bacteriocin/lantibiotic exporter with double-glycine peptidase domain